MISCRFAKHVHLVAISANGCHMVIDKYAIRVPRHIDRANLTAYRKVKRLVRGVLEAKDDLGDVTNDPIIYNADTITQLEGLRNTNREPIICITANACRANPRTYTKPLLRFQPKLIYIVYVELASIITPNVRLGKGTRDIEDLRC